MSVAIGPLLGAAVSLFTGMKSASLQAKAMKAQERQQALADERERRRLVRQAQIAKGEAVNVAASIGGMGSTGLIGGTSGLNNQVASQIGYQAQSSALAKQYSGLMQQAGNYQMYGDFFGPMLGKMDFGSIKIG